MNVFFFIAGIALGFYLKGTFLSFAKTKTLEPKKEEELKATQEETK